MAITMTTTTTLSTLPTDVLVIVFEFLFIGDLESLALTCKSLHFVVDSLGWTTYLIHNPRFAPSLSKTLRTWDPRSQIRYHALSDRAWSKDAFVARPMARPWQGRLQPSITVSNSRLVVAAGAQLYSYLFTPSQSANNSPCIRYEAIYTLDNRGDGRKDITSASFVPGSDSDLYVGFGDGTLGLVTLPAIENTSSVFPPQVQIPDENIKRHDLHGGDVVQSLCSRDKILLSLSLEGTAVLSNFAKPQSPISDTINIQKRSWSSYLSTRGNLFAAFGTASTDPLSIHDISSSQLSPSPSALLAVTDGIQFNRSPAAAYGICGTPHSVQWGSDKVIVSGWYDGFVRMHDLRASKRAVPSPGSPRSPAPLLPVLSYNALWSFEPIYSVATGGGSSNHIAAGCARHSVVAFWDVRAPAKGWSVHAPGNDVSPVYSVVLESSRLFGATQSRPFVYDFGPGVDRNTYPKLKWNTRDGLQPDPDGVGFYVTKFKHRK